MLNYFSRLQISKQFSLGILGICLLIFGFIDYFFIASEIKEQRLQASKEQQNIMNQLRYNYDDLMYQIVHDSLIPIAGDSVLTKSDKIKELKDRLAELIKGQNKAVRQILLTNLKDDKLFAIVSNEEVFPKNQKFLEAEDNKPIRRFREPDSYYAYFSFKKSIPGVYLAKRITNKENQFVLLEVDLTPWYHKIRDILPRDMLGIIKPIPGGNYLFLNFENVEKGLSFKNELSEKSKNLEETGQKLVTVEDREFSMRYNQSMVVPLRFITYQKINIFSKDVINKAGILIAGSLLMMMTIVVFVFFISRRIRKSVRSVEDKIIDITHGEFEKKRQIKAASEELLDLADRTNELEISINNSNFRQKVIYRAITDLFDCYTLDNLMAKATELVCTQCKADFAKFLPNQNSSRCIKMSHEVEISGWEWRNYQLKKICDEIDLGIPGNKDGFEQKEFSFSIQGQLGQQETIGTLFVKYVYCPDDAIISVLYSLVSTIEAAVSKLQLLRQEIFVDFETDVKEAIQREHVSNSVTVSQNQIAYHYRPGDQFGGNWFSITEGKDPNKLFLVMGDVAGKGLAQSMVVALVRGALDVIEKIIKEAEEHTFSNPSKIISFIDESVSRILGKNRLNMSCLAVKFDFLDNKITICNAGHPFPILIRNENIANIARYLSEKQQPPIGLVNLTGEKSVYSDVEYNILDGDVLLFYTDGLIKARNLDAKVFGRFLFKRLQKKRDEMSAENLKNEIIELFKYYTQDQKLADDVCFLLIKTATKIKDIEQEKEPTKISA